MVYDILYINNRTEFFEREKHQNNPVDLKLNLPIMVLELEPVAVASLRAILVQILFFRREPVCDPFDGWVPISVLSFVSCSIIILSAVECFNILLVKENITYVAGKIITILRPFLQSGLSLAILYTIIRDSLEFGTLHIITQGYIYILLPALACLVSKGRKFMLFEEHNNVTPGRFYSSVPQTVKWTDEFLDS